MRTLKNRKILKDEINSLDFFYILGTNFKPSNVNNIQFKSMTSASYIEISKEVGYIGYLSYPSVEEADYLLERLSSNPTISDFKQALSLYRFVPEAKTADQQKIIHMLQLGLSLARKELFESETKTSFAKVAVNYVMNLFAI